MIAAVAEQPALTFDPETHSYTVAGRRLPSVTQVIGSVLPGWQADAWYLQRGSALHHGCRLMDERRLDWSTVSPEIAGQLAAWKQFRADVRGEIVACELGLCDLVHGFAGTLDRVFVIESKETIIDIKHSIAPQVKIQLGGYKLLRERNGFPIVKRGIAVELRSNGTYGTLWMDQRELEPASRTFLAALTIHNFKQQNNINPPKEKIQ